MLKLFVVAATLSVAFGAAIDDAIKAFEAGDSKVPYRTLLLPEH